MELLTSFLFVFCLMGCAAEANTTTSPPPPSLYKILPRPCSITKQSQSYNGICMFVWECLKSDGKHLGMCKEGFMFGSCCTHDSFINDVEQTGSGSDDDSLFVTKISTGRPPSGGSWFGGVTEVGVDEVVGMTGAAETTTATPTTTVTPTTTTTPTTTPPPPPTTTPPSSAPTPTTDQPETETYFINPNLITTTEESINHDLDKQIGCGIAPLVPQMRIVGGKESSFAEYPWIVSVRRTSFFGFSSTHRCGGALINENWIATAGHCVDDLLISQIRIRLGEWDFSSSVGEKYPYIERGVVKKSVHPSYNFFTYESDIALLKLDKSIQLTPHILPLCLPGNNDLLIGENATLAGWGRLSEGGQLPNRLNVVTVPIISNELCRQLFLKSGRIEHIPDIFLCAGEVGGGRDSCQGDSGGPLQVRGSDGRWFLGGIISWGIGCAEPNMPGVCTRISKFRDWILEQVVN